MERVKGIEPVYKAWEAFVLPLNYTRMADLQSMLPIYLSDYRNVQIFED
jgi:hypothetical protein